MTFRFVPKLQKLEGRSLQLPRCDNFKLVTLIITALDKPDIHTVGN